MPAWVPLSSTSLKILATHWPGPSSVAAVSHMQSQIRRNKGRRTWATIPPNDTPAAVLSVGGKVARQNMTV